MYYVVLLDEQNLAHLITEHETLVSAAKNRCCHADIVLNEDLLVNQEIDWLWGWELKDSGCFARQTQIKNPTIMWASGSDRPK